MARCLAHRRPSVTVGLLPPPISRRLRGLVALITLIHWDSTASLPSTPHAVGPQAESQAGEVVMLAWAQQTEGKATLKARERHPYNAPEVTQLLLHVISFHSPAHSGGRCCDPHFADGETEVRDQSRVTQEVLGGAGTCLSP